MADLPRSLISKTALSSDLTTVLQSGVRVDWFEDDEHRRVFQWMIHYLERYGKEPTAHALKLEFPTYRLLKTKEPIEYYIDKFRSQRHRIILVDTMIDVNEALDDNDIQLAQNRLMQGLTQVSAEVSTLADYGVLENWEARIAQYEEDRKFAGELTGVPTGFPTFDMVTGGFQAEQFIIFAGAQKQGKSWMMMKSAIAAQEYGKKVLFVTFEMSEREQVARYDALTSGLDSNKVLQNILSDKDMEKLDKERRSRRNLPELIISADISATTTPSGLAAKITEHQPDIVFVDGVYLMENEDGAQPLTPQAYTSLSRSLKRLAQRIEIPVVGTLQALQSKMAKSGVVTMLSLAWSSSWGQDADLVYGIERDEGSPIIKMRIVGGRHVSPKEVGIACNWEESIFEEYDEDEQPD